MQRHLAVIVSIAIIVGFGSIPGRAAETGATGATGAVTVFVNKARVMRLDADADVVLIANPEIADVVVDSPRLLFVLGLSPGETSLLILDANREEILQTDVVVVSAEAASPAAEVTEAPRPSAPVLEVKVLRRTEQTTLSCAPRCAAVSPEVGAQ